MTCAPPSRNGNAGPSSKLYRLPDCSLRHKRLLEDASADLFRLNLILIKRFGFTFYWRVRNGTNHDKMASIIKRERRSSYVRPSLRYREEETG